LNGCESSGSAQVRVSSILRTLLTIISEFPARREDNVQPAEILTATYAVDGAATSLPLDPARINKMT
jgi:hypothetical protein